MRRITPLAVVFLVACGTDPAPSGPPGGGADSGTAPVDSGFAPLDSGWFADAEVPDAGEAAPDAEPADLGVADAGAPDLGTPDTGPADTGTPDAGAPDTGTPDTGPADVGFPDAGFPDTGPVLTDGDNDFLTDAQEGNGTVDTDGDGTPDSQDPDSDGDGIPDAEEAGDTDLLTPPRDSDFDGIPDFRDTDADGDNIDDAVEGLTDPDGDGVPSYLDDDSDGDTILDIVEGAQDPDGDTMPNYLDLDSDGDTSSDAFEAGDLNPASPPIDSDFDSTPNYLDADSDNDFLSDRDEGRADTDGDGIFDYIDIDADNDSILDRFEAGDQDLLTPPLNSDTDPLPDYLDLDSDDDTLTDLQEGRTDTDGDTVEDRIETDSDGDGWTDAIEAGDADPLTPAVNTDGDQLPDYRDLDSDNDGLRDIVELGCPAGPNRLVADSDADTFDDLAEVAYGSDPCDVADVIDDFYFVLPPNGPPANAPLSFTDTQIDRADTAINIDTTGSMGGEIANLRTSLSTQIIPQIGAAVPDAAFAVSSFEDFPVTPFGDAASGDLPFRLGTRVTSNAATAQAAVNALTTRSGVDFPEAGLESLYQVTTGLGTSWAGGTVPAFDVNRNRVPGVADGVIGGVGFRPDSLPIVIHVTDAVSQTDRAYAASTTQINAATPTQVRQSLSNIGARVVTITSGPQVPFNDQLCAGGISTFFGDISSNDVDWFELTGAVAGDTVTVDVIARGFLSPLDPMVAVANATSILQMNDDIATDNADSRLTNVTLSGAGPYYVAVTSFSDNNFDGVGGTTQGHYLVNVSTNGTARSTTQTICRAEDPNSRVNATSLVPFAQTMAPMDQAMCQANCDTLLGGQSPFFADFTFPYEMSQDTGATIPACAWSFFGSARPTGCTATQCCTGENGAGVAPDANGQCPLSFVISDTGAGLGNALVAGVEALVNFSTFTITTQLRPDPVQFANGLDTTCFIQSVIPVSATPPNTCAPTPVAADLVPPAGQLDSFLNVVPGTVLDFQVNALNQQSGTMNPCVASTNSPQQFTAFIDVVADNVTVVDTRQVIIIVPPTPAGGAN